MKIWKSYGSEHSMNLVIIGRFQEARSAEQAKEFIENLSQQVASEPALDPDQYDFERKRRRFSDAVMDLFKASSIWTLSPQDLEELRYEKQLEQKGSELIITSEESDFAVFLKIMIEKGARIEVYSAHDYPDTGHGRPKTRE